MKNGPERRVARVTPRQAMDAAIAEARAGLRAGQSPFGCAIVHYGRVVARAHNTVWRSTDATAHAEVNAIRKACRRLKTIDLSDCVLYTTCEPCPMCFSAAHWARIRKVVFGARIRDAQAAGFNELVIASERMRKFAGDGMTLVTDFLADECRALFAEWRAHSKGKAY
jgi:tRNA(Arg) A34 adenosine deaminase TadA